MTVTGDQRGSESSPSVARAAVEEMIDAGLLDELMRRVDAGEVALTGEGGLLPEMLKAVLQRGLQAELTGHLGDEKGDPAGRGSPNSRNGSTPKTVQTEVGPVSLDVPRDRAGSFEPRLVPKGVRRAVRGRCATRRSRRRGRRQRRRPRRIGPDWWGGRRAGWPPSRSSACACRRS